MYVGFSRTTGPCYNFPIQLLLAALIAVSCLSIVSVRPSFAQQAGAPSSASSLDFETFKTRVLPILTSPRKGNARCIACHSRGGGNSFLEPLTPGASAYTDEQARRNFERVQRLVVPGEPTKSVLLTNPLAEEAGGSHWHGGGKHWTSQSDAEWQTLAAWVATKAEPSNATPSLDFETFRARVQPILTTARKGNARCIACHSRGGGNSFLEPLAPGSTTYSDEQTRRNFDRIQRLVVPGEPDKSGLLMNPLAENAGGSHWHGGGKHWSSKSDPEFEVLAAWVRGSAR
jgi:mono/diheme cytochrome c family protein